MTRSFRVYALPADLCLVFEQVQKELEVFYCECYGEAPDELEDLAVCFKEDGRKMDEMFFIFLKGTACSWEKYPAGYVCSVRTKAEGVCLDFSGLRAMQTGHLGWIEVSTVFYENENSGKIFTALRKVFRRYSVETVRGCMICPSAYENRETYAFC